MALSSSELSALIKQKIDTYKDEKAALPDDDPSKTDISYILDAIAEAVVEHITTKAEIKIAIVGQDLGTSLSAELEERFIARGDTAVPGALIPDTNLQTDPSSTSPTTAPLVSVMISTPGFID